MFIEYKRGDSHDWELDRGHKKTIDHLGSITERIHLESVDAAGRDYDFFGLLAGVRSCAKPVFNVRGLPKNLSTPLKEDVEMWGVDIHTKSYLSLAEYKQVLEIDNFEVSKTGKKGIAFYRNGYSCFPSYIPGWCDIYHHCHGVMERSQVDAILLGDDNLAFKKCRLVFFFDS